MAVIIEKRIVFLHDLFRFFRVVRQEEAIGTEGDRASLMFDTNGLRMAVRPSRQIPERGFIVVQRGGQADASRVAARDFLQSGQQTQHLQSAIRPHEGVNLIYDNKPQVPEKAGCL